jgi:hypothetical protein
MARRSTVETGGRRMGDMPPRLALGMPGALAGLSTRGMSLRNRRLKGAAARGKAAAAKRLPEPVLPADEELDAIEDLRHEPVATDRDAAAEPEAAEFEEAELEAADGDEAPVDRVVDVEDDDGDLAVADLPVDDLPVEALPVEALQGEADLAVDVSLPPLAATGTSRPADVNVDSLLAELEAGQRSTGRTTAARGSARRRLEDLLERKRVARELEDFEDFEI